MLHHLHLHYHQNLHTSHTMSSQNSAGTMTVEDIYGGSDENTDPCRLAITIIEYEHLQDFTWLGEVDIGDSPLRTLNSSSLDMESQSSTPQTAVQKHGSKGVTEAFKPPRSVIQQEEKVESSHAGAEHGTEEEDASKPSPPTCHRVGITGPPALEVVDTASQTSGGMSSQSQTGSESGGRNWTQTETNLLLALLNHTRAKSGTRNGFRQQQILAAARYIKAKGGREFTAKQVHSKYDRLKRGDKLDFKLNRASGGG